MNPNDCSKSKSISGINSITTGSGSDNLLTIHTSDASSTERVRINSSGDVIVGSGITVSPDGDIFATGVCTATSFSGDGSALTGIDLGAVTGATGDFSIADKIVHTGDTNTTVRFPAADTITAETGGSERLRIDSSGNINFGAEKSAAFPSGTGIQVYQSANPRIKLVNDTTGNGATDGTQIYLSSDGDTIIDNKDSEDIIFHCNASEKVRLTNGGSFGVGTNSPNDTLHVYHATDNLVARFESGDTGGGITLKDNTHVTSLLTTNGAFEINVDQGSDISGETIAFKMSGSEKVRIDSNGRFCINCTSANANLQVQDTSSNVPHIRIETSDGGNKRLDLKVESSNGIISSEQSAQELHLKSTSHTKFYIDGTQEFMISSTNGRLERSFGGGSGSGSDLDGMWFNNDQAASGTFIRFWQTSGSYGANQIGSISHSANNTAYNTSSDYRLKENINPITDAITRLKTLKPSRFNFKTEPSVTVDGFIAHEVTAVPEAITGTKDEVDSNGDPLYQGIDQSKLVPLLTAALQEAISEIETLKTEVAALKSS